ncbi:MAG: hypothetical protein ACKVVP_23865 [Chloroflexota bacterium]
MEHLQLHELRVGIEARSATALSQDHQWLIPWQVTNLSNETLAIDEVRIPHDQFQGSDVTVLPALAIPAGGMIAVPSVVRFHEPALSVLTYPFIIIRGLWRGQAYRVFGRLRVETNVYGAPQPFCEEVTVQIIRNVR